MANIDYHAELTKFDSRLTEAARGIVSESLDAYKRSTKQYAVSVKEMITNITLPRIHSESDMLAYELISKGILVNPETDSQKAIEYASKRIQDLL